MLAVGQPSLQRTGTRWPCPRRLWGVIFIRLAGLFFAFVQITLVLRLALPFVEVPPGLLEYVPALMDITDVWMLPVEAIIDKFEITGVAEDLAAAGDDSISGPEEFEPLVLVAMLFWGVTAMFGLFVLRLIFKPAG
jgi:hypothetical protein